MSISMKTGLSVREDNQPGVLSEMTELISDAGVNIEGIAASADQDRGWVHLYVDNPDKAAGALKERGYTVRQDEVIVVELPDEVGALSRVTNFIAGADIDIKTVYATVDGETAKVVIRTSANRKALELIEAGI